MWLVLLVPLLAAPVQDTRQVYLRARALYKAGQYAKAGAHFRTLLPRLEEAQRKAPRGDRSWHMLSLGQCDVLFHLAEVSWRGGQKRRSCRYSARLDGLHKRIPAAWPTWNVHPELPDRLRKGLQQFGKRCPAVASLLRLRVTPAQARVQRKVGTSWAALQSRQLRTKETRLTLRVQAPGYFSKTQRVSVPRWHEKTVRLVLKKKPVVVATRKPPRPPPRPRPVATPLYKRWWLWAGIGVLAAGGITAAVLVATARREEVLVGDSPDEPFKLFQP